MKSNNDDKHGHGQEKGDPQHYVEDIKIRYIYIYIYITRFGKPEPKDRCIEWKIQTAINEKACKSMRGKIRTIKSHKLERRKWAAQKHLKTWKRVFWTI